MLKRAALVALLAVCVVSAKNYSFEVTEPTQAGNIQLKPGQYTVQVAASQVVLVDNNGNRIDSTAIVEPGDRKFAYTSIQTTKADGTNRIQEIDLGGTHNRVVFQ